MTSRWGLKGSHEVSEGLTASYKYEAKMNTTNAASSGAVGHEHDAVVIVTEDADNDPLTPETPVQDTNDVDNPSHAQAWLATLVQAADCPTSVPFRWIWNYYIRSNLVGQCHPLWLCS